GQQIEGHETCRSLLRQQPHPARGWMNALLEDLEVEPVARRSEHDDLAVDHAAGREVGLDRFDELGKVPRHRLLVTAADLDLVAVAKDDRPKAVPLGLEAQCASRNVLD